jgi:hypothetical protein
MNVSKTKTITKGENVIDHTSYRFHRRSHHQFPGCIALHDIVNDNRTFVYRVARMGLGTARQLEREFVNADQILRQYWLHHSIRNRNHL